MLRIRKGLGQGAPQHRIDQCRVVIELAWAVGLLQRVGRYLRAQATLEGTPVNPVEQLPVTRT
jgi:hypothetical protein